MRKMMFLAAAAAAAGMVFAGCSGKAADYPRFDGARAFEQLRMQVDSGPRVPGTPNQRREADLMTQTLKGYADEVRQDVFKKPVNGKMVEFRNIYAAFNKGAKDWVLLCAHWDTRPFADQEVDEARKSQPIPGANDGASGTAVLLEMARLLHEKKPDVGVFIALFDGEDYGDSLSTMFYGSEYFADNLSSTAVVNGKRVRFRYAVLLDMIGDKDLDIHREMESEKKSKDIDDKIWKAAADLGYSKEFIDDQKYSISDDHIPLIRAGIKAVDLIDFNYGPWHTLDDTTDKCSAASLEKVGRTITKVVYDEAP